jgi:hypothetical protein
MQHVLDYCICGTGDEQGHRRLKGLFADSHLANTRNARLVQDSDATRNKASNVDRDFKILFDRSACQISERDQAVGHESGSTTLGSATAIEVSTSLCDRRRRRLKLAKVL